MPVLKDVIKISEIKGGTVKFFHPLVLSFFIGVMHMLINKEHLEKKEINSKVHKVRAIIMNDEGKVYITNMDYSYNLPGGRVEANENLKDALIREIAEELGIRVAKKEIQYIGNITFWHKDFPGEKGSVNRENNVDLFWVVNPKEIKPERVQLTNYEKHYHFHLMNCNFKEIQDLLNNKNENEYKRFTDVELKICLEEFEKYRKEDKLC